MSNIDLIRLDETLKEEISQLIRVELKDPRLVFVH
jgi:ribosome-binding factor A